jgi:hypothetical protein
LACVPALRVTAGSDAAAYDSKTTVAASDSVTASEDNVDAVNTGPVSETAAHAASAAFHDATTVKAASTASATTHPPAPARLHFDERVLHDPPVREHRLTIEPFAAVVKLKGVSRQPRAVADVLVQGARGPLQVGINHESLPLLQLHLHLVRVEERD